MTVKITTFGCRLNTYESEVIRTFLQNNKNFAYKDITIFNSCTVTAEAEKQLRQAIRKEKRDNPNAIIGVVGCAAQTNSNTYRQMNEVDFVLGNIDKMKPENYENAICKAERSIVVSNILEMVELAPQLITGFEEKTRGFIQIQSGCNNHCTFCATRLARGKSISIPSARVINQINKLVKNGYNEIVLTGIDITDYGNGLDESINLGKLIKKIIAETDLPRLRLSSVDIADINDDLKDVLFNEKRLMPHLHISLQSGDNTILKRMARRHNREQIIDFCQEIKNYRANIAIGADLIAGFPTETEEMHQNSCQLIQEIGLVFGHIFPYSIRENTPAALMEQVPMEIRRRRAKELREIAKEQYESFFREQSQLEHLVLIENETTGRTENYLTVKLKPDIFRKNKIGDIVKIDGLL